MANAPDVRNVAAGSGSLNSSVPTMPTHQANDIIIVVAMTANQAFPSMPAGWGYAPSGNTPGIGTAGAAGGVRLHILYTRATSAAQTAPDFGDSGDVQYVRAMSVANVITTGDPWDATANYQPTTNTTSLIFPAITTTTANTLVVLAVAMDKDQANTASIGTVTNANLASITERMDQTVTTGTGGGVGCLTAANTATGNIGNSTHTFGAATFYSSWTGALKPIPDPIARPWARAVFI